MADVLLEIAQKYANKVAKYEKILDDLENKEKIPEADIVGLNSTTYSLAAGVFSLAGGILKAVLSPNPSPDPSYEVYAKPHDLYDFATAVDDASRHSGSREKGGGFAWMGTIYSQITLFSNKSSLVVSKGNSTTLSYKKDEFKDNYRILVPKNIDEVKQALGIPKEVQLKLSPSRLASLSVLQTSVPIIEDFSNPELADKTIKNVRLAAQEYVQGDYKLTENWKNLINDWISKSDATIRIAQFKHVIVEDGAVLKVCSDTNALYTNSIKLHGSAAIHTEKDLTIDCTSMDGYI